MRLFDIGISGAIGDSDTFHMAENTNFKNQHKRNIDHLKQVRLSDIDILGAIGDSDTAAFAARSTGIHTYFTGDLDSDGDVGDGDDNDDNDNISS